MFAVRIVCLTLAVLFSLLVVCAVRAESPAEIVAAFSDQQNDAAWMKNRRYMRRLDDTAWKTRMTAMQKLVARGKASVPALIEALNSGDDQTRIFAAQTLSYLAPQAPREALLAAAKSDRNSAVRLYAVDAIGMQGGIDPGAELNPLKKQEKNRDVLKHIGYALERGRRGVAPDVIETMVKWDARTIDSAKVGKPAPDFELATVDGQKIRLADYRGKRPVVLAFVYGDT